MSKKYKCEIKLISSLLGIKSENVRLMAGELRELEPFVSALKFMLELDDEIRLIEICSEKMESIHHKRFHLHLAVCDLKFNPYNKKINLSVLSTAEESKNVTLDFGNGGVFKFDVIGLKESDVVKILNAVDYKIQN